jgi:large subunit ribosomal protein L7A
MLMSLDVLKESARVTGVKQVTKALKKGQVRCVFLAEDANAQILLSLAELAGRQGVPVERIGTMKELGRAAGIEVGAAAAAALKVPPR